ncbi:MAG: sugar ABC transporter ATP-binding protein [Eubacteriales bacterium]|nr:sugar ABC transporter ATP-binding protein [Eubacteriales bacterium]
MPDTLLKMEGIHKYFPGVHALNNVSFQIHPGEVVALVGENGAGKSTLMKVLTGVYQKDEGSIYMDGKEVNIQNTLDSQALGISIVHQELNLMNDLTVAENLFIGREPMKGLMVDSKKQNQMAKDIMQVINLQLDPKTKVGNLTVAKQQMVEIAKALSYTNTRILILDEPTASLTESEIEELFEVIRDLKAKGVAIIYISHRMDELKVISDAITVMRDGQYIGTVLTKETPMSEIVNMMVGRAITWDQKQKSNVPEDAPVLLEVMNLHSKDVIDVSFTLRRGEILGFSGLMGAGRTEAMRLICGADKMDAGSIYLDGKKLNVQSPYDAVNAGIGYLSEDRKRYGLCLGLSCADNIILPDLEHFTSGLIMDDNKKKAVAEEYKKRIKIKTPTVETPAISLSGGNQQKVVIAKWLVRNCDVLIFDEPTRGIDVGAKSEIYDLMDELAKEGKAIIMVSSDMPEILRMSDRVAVMCEGKLTGILPIEEATQEKIMQLATPGVN